MVLKAIPYILVFILLMDSSVTAGTIEVAGAIRRTEGKGWAVLNDANHAPLNVKSVTTDNGIIVITFPFTAMAIHTFIATVDDTLAYKGYSVGASVSLSSASIVISKVNSTGATFIDANVLNEPHHNIWFYGLFKTKD